MSLLLCRVSGHVRMAWLRNAGSEGVGTWRPPVTTPLPPAAIDYSDGAVLEAKHLLLAATAFVEDARAYMRGQLACGPIGEDVLWER